MTAVIKAASVPEAQRAAKAAFRRAVLPVKAVRAAIESSVSAEDSAAVHEVLVVGLPNVGHPYATGDLLGDSPNQSQQAAADARARRQQQETAQRNGAPAPEEFALSMMDANTGREVAPGQGSIFGAQQRVATTTMPSSRWKRAWPRARAAGSMPAW